MALDIPNRYVPILDEVRNLPESAVAELLRALESSSITATPQDLVEHIAKAVPSIPKEELSRVVDLLYSLYHVREFSEVNKNAFLKELIEGLREHPKLKISD